MLTVVPGPDNGAEDPHVGPATHSGSMLDELVREGARRMLAEALQAEVEDYIARHVGERDERGQPTSQHAGRAAMFIRRNNTRAERDNGRDRGSQPS